MTRAVPHRKRGHLKNQAASAFSGAFFAIEPKYFNEEQG